MSGALIEQYNRDAEAHSEPWQFWEYKYPDSHRWEQLNCSPCWRSKAEYRRKPNINKGHVHAKLMAEYAKDALTHEKPWELWRYEHEGVGWLVPSEHPRWLDDVKYKRVGKTILINGYEVNEPIRYKLEEWDIYYATGPYYDWARVWKSTEADVSSLELGFIHLNEESAKQHFIALSSFTRKR